MKLEMHDEQCSTFLSISMWCHVFQGLSNIALTDSFLLEFGVHRAGFFR